MTDPNPFESPPATAERSPVVVSGSSARTNRVAGLVYLPLALIPMAIGGYFLLMMYAFASMIHSGIPRIMYWRILLEKIWPSMAIPLAIFNAGPALVIGCLWNLIAVRPTAIRVAVISWVVLTILPVAAVGVFLWIAARN